MFFAVTENRNTTLLEQAGNKLKIRISHGNCLTYEMNLSNACLEVSKKYRLSLGMDSYYSDLTVQNGSQAFTLTLEGKLDTTFAAELESLDFNFYYVCHSYLTTLREFNINNISIQRLNKILCFMLFKKAFLHFTKVLLIPQGGGDKCITMLDIVV